MDIQSHEIRAMSIDTTSNDNEFIPRELWPVISGYSIGAEAVILRLSKSIQRILLPKIVNIVTRVCSSFSFKYTSYMHEFGKLVMFNPCTCECIYISRLSNTKNTALDTYDEIYICTAGNKPVIKEIKYKRNNVPDGMSFPPKDVSWATISQFASDDFASTAYGIYPTCNTIGAITRIYNEMGIDTSGVVNRFGRIPRFASIGAGSYPSDGLTPTWDNFLYADAATLQEIHAFSRTICIMICNMNLLCYANECMGKIVKFNALSLARKIAIRTYNRGIFTSCKNPDELAQDKTNEIQAALIHLNELLATGGYIPETLFPIIDESVAKCIN